VPKPKVLVTKRFFSEPIAELAKHAEVDYEPTDDGLTSVALVERARGKRAVITQVTDQLGREVLTQLKGLGLIAHLGVGYDNIDLPAATENGIMVTNTPGVLDDTTADLAFALMLAAARRITEAHQFIHDGNWKRWTLDLMIGRDVHHRTLGILGMGRIGQTLARRAGGFSMRVLYHNRTRLPEQTERVLAAEWVSKERLLRESDFVSIHLPLNAETRGSVGETELRMMKPDAVLVNTARGPVVVETALVRALKEKWIAGAGLDVFEREPQLNPGLLECPNAVLTPHVGSSTVDTRMKMAMMTVDNVVAMLSGQRPPNILNPPVWDRWASRPASAE